MQLELITAEHLAPRLIALRRQSAPRRRRAAGSLWVEQSDTQGRIDDNSTALHAQVRERK